MHFASWLIRPHLLWPMMSWLSMGPVVRQRRGQGHLLCAMYADPLCAFSGLLPLVKGARAAYLRLCHIQSVSNTYGCTMGRHAGPSFSAGASSQAVHVLGCTLGRCQGPSPRCLLRRAELVREAQALGVVEGRPLRGTGARGLRPG